MNKNILALLLAFFCFVILEGHAQETQSDSEEAETLQLVPKQVVYILLHNVHHELHQPVQGSSSKKKSSKQPPDKKKEWVLGSDQNHTFLPEQKASLTIKGLTYPNSIQFLFESTSFESGTKPISFTYGSAYFLNKIETLSPTQESKKYNHLCLTLYAVYKEGDKRKVTESPLYVRWKEKNILNDDGILKKEATAKFYTLCTPSISGRLAYFTTGASGNDIKAQKDSEVFPIQCSSCYGQTELTPICKQFFENHKTAKCNQGSRCGHTEPNAWFHVLKHKEKLFKPLIGKAGGLDQVTNVGFRFFSFYQSCGSCLQFLKESKGGSLKIKDRDYPVNFLYYFQRIYSTNQHVVKLRGKQPRKRFINLHNNGQLLMGLPTDDNKIEVEWEEKLNKLGCINLPEKINLDDNNKILLIHPLPDKDISEEEKLNIYVVK